MSNSEGEYSVDAQVKIDQLADQFESDFRAGLEPSINDFLQRYSGDRRALLRELIALEIELRRAEGDDPDPEEYQKRFPDDHEIVELIRYGDLPDTVGASESESTEDADDDPESIGRYSVLRQLGRGAFGVVYLAHDPQLNRPVALKVPRRKRFESKKQISSFIAEARTAAGLKHESLVSVYDVQQEDGLPYIVQEYIDGEHLGAWQGAQQLTFEQLARILTTIAEALGYAHQQGLVHCDLKFANVLMDSRGQPHVADFGLAVHEHNKSDWRHKRFGTPNMMSPEQVRGEGHRVDGRTDIWAMGVMMYELMVNRRPFGSSDREELYDQILTLDPRPPRQVDRGVPRELERICLKCLAKRPTDRYNSAHDLRDDLFVWLDTGEPKPTRSPSVVVSVKESDVPNSDSSSETKSSHAVIPKGLRSFDESDADFFRDLVPGPRDRDGLPDVLRFWKGRIEATDAEKAFSVGLIYGPSGCGKSSLVKAGLIPSLSDGILPICVEATNANTEGQILRQFQKHIPRLQSVDDLRECCADLRIRGAGRYGKTLLIIDQFEQWLHAHKDHGNTSLVEALRQADGIHLQCILLVRDDFWMAVMHFARELEIKFVDGLNQAVVDLFSERHALKVLTAYGQAFTALGEDLSITEQQTEFLKQSVASLAEDGKIFPIRLALFAEMMKHRAWEPQSLQEIGGSQGVGEAFLNETFTSRFASPEHRYHEDAARRVLTSLLPESGANIKGHVRSEAELLAESGYEDGSIDFDNLIRILDADLRLITPADTGGQADSEGNRRTAKYYQLTHDYLVPSLRQWLTRRQLENPKGRAELRLDERSSIWNVKPENRHLPSWWEYLNIVRLTDRQNWTKRQQKMLNRAARVHGMRLTTGVSIIILGVAVIYGFMASVQQRHRAERLETVVAMIGNSPWYSLPDAIDNLNEFPPDLVVDELTRRFPASSNSKQRALACALAQYDQGDPEFLVASIADSRANECANIVAALSQMRSAAVSTARMKAEEADRAADWALKGRLAIVALHLGDPSIAASMVQNDVRSGPTQQTVFVHEVFPGWHGDLNLLADRSLAIEDESLKSLISLAVGDLPADEVGDAQSTWQNLLTGWYSSSSDSGTHSAAAWALRQWDSEFPEIEPDADIGDSSPRNWRITPQGLTMIRIPAGKFQRTDGITTQTVELSRDYWLSDVEVPRKLFRAFQMDPRYTGIRVDLGDGEAGNGMEGRRARTVSWEDAVLFCNWLSGKEGYIPCYEVTPIEDPGFGATSTIEVRLSNDGTGYRLPTEAEWEYGCRAGTTTDFCFGDDVKWLSRYAVFSVTKPDVIASRMCNRWGLFDMHGNLSEWCHDVYHLRYVGDNVRDPIAGEIVADSQRDEESSVAFKDLGNPFTEASESDDPFADSATGGPPDSEQASISLPDTSAPAVWTNQITRVTRGGNWETAARSCTSRARLFFYPNERGSRTLGGADVGFRVARTAVQARQDQGR